MTGFVPRAFQSTGQTFPSFYSKTVTSDGAVCPAYMNLKAINAAIVLAVVSDAAAGARC